MKEYPVALDSFEILRLPSHPEQIRFFFKASLTSLIYKYPTILTLSVYTQYFAYSNGGQKESSKTKADSNLQLIAFKQPISDHAWENDALLLPPQVHLHRTILLDENWHKIQTILLLARLTQFTDYKIVQVSYLKLQIVFGAMIWRATSSGYLSVGKKLISRVLNTMWTNFTYLRDFKLVVSATFIVEILLKLTGHESTQSCFTLAPFLIPFSFTRGVTSTQYFFNIVY